MRPALPKPVAANHQQRLAMYEAAPKLAPKVQWRYAYTLYLLDRFEEALQLCEELVRTPRDHVPTAEQMLLYAELLEKTGDQDGVARAEAILKAQLQRKMHDEVRVNALVALADIARDRRDFDTARTCLLEAIDLKPLHAAAIRKYAVVEIDSGNPPDLLAKCEQLLAAGYVSPRLTATYVSALAANDRIDDAREVRGFEELFRKGTLPVPEGYYDLASFNRDLEAELFDHPSLRFENSRRASNESWRIDQLFVANSDRVKLLLETINRAVEDYVAQVVDAEDRKNDTLFDRFRPEEPEISSWAVLTKAEGHENWHIHGGGWISGVYYVTVPEGLEDVSDTAGAIDFGWAERLLGDGAAERLGLHRVRPKAGDLLLFPSYLHHRTWPHGLDDDRICVAFDIVAK